MQRKGTLSGEALEESTLKITIVNQFYPPDVSPTARLAASLAQHRATLGDSVTVIGGHGYLGSGQPSEDADDGNDSQTIQAAKCSPANLNVHRLWTPKSGKRTLVHRCLDYLAFYILACTAIARLPKQDVVVCLTTPPMIAGAGVLHKFIHRTTRVILWNMDCYPEVVVRAGMIRKNGLIDRFWQWVNCMIGSQLSHVVCLDDAMQKLLKSRPNARHIPISIIPNWESLAEFPALKRDGTAKTFFPPFTLLYSGNMGHGHCFEALLSAARRLLEKGSPIEIVMTGGGVQSFDIQRRINEERLTNINFKGYVTAQELREIRAYSHCAFISLKDNMLGCMSPSKLHASLAVGLPVVYLGPPGSSVDLAIEKFECGESLRNDDIDHFVDRLEVLSASPDLIKQYSKNARNAFEKSYCDRSNLSLFDALMDDSRGDMLDRTARNRAA